jgi:hypothetical protein
MSPASGDPPREFKYLDKETVSIQLMSPASGDTDSGKINIFFHSTVSVSIQLMSPASGDVHATLVIASDTLNWVSIQLMSPASGD